MDMFKKSNFKIIIVLIVSFIIAFLFVFFLDWGLLKALYDLYYGDSDISVFFEEQGQNVFASSTRITTFKFVLSRFIYSVIPISIGCFLGGYYHSTKIPEKITNKKIFVDNPSLARILNISRYLIGAGLAFLIISFKRTFFNSTFHNCLLGNTEDFIRIIISTAIFLILIIDWGSFYKDLKSFPNRHKKITVILSMLVVSVISCCLVEFQAGSKMYNMLSYLIHVNIMYWFLLQIVILILFRNMKPGAVISLLFSYVIGLSNDIVYQFRGNYIMFGDITVVRTALEVAGNYTYKTGFWFWICIAILIISIFLVIISRIPKDAFISSNTTKLGRVFWTVILEGIVVLFVFFSFKTGDFYGKVFGVGWDYNDNVTAVGYLPYFFSNMDSTARIELENYNAERVKKIFENISYNRNMDKAEIEPNIILIQNEAFSDLSITSNMETDIDPMPYIHSLSENVEKGYLNMSVTGGPTSNTEFEVLSRCSLQFFPFGSVPYTQYLKQNIPSLVEVLHSQPISYETLAYHSYYSSGYNRNSVYDYIGFDDKLFENDFLNDFQEEDIPRGYLSDEENYKRVINAFEENKNSGKPFFCFNVTIQGHGGYTGGPYNLPERVNVTNFSATESINTYLSCIKMSDTAFKNLINYFESVEEPTIIMMYGDHQPAFDDDAKKQIEEHPAWSDEVQQKLSKYYVPYVIWANYDIEEYDGLKGWNENIEDYMSSERGKTGINRLSTNYVGSYLLEKAGLELSDYDRFLLGLHKDVPAMTAIGVWKDGEYYPNAASTPDNEKLKQLELIQYNLIFDKENKLTDRFLSSTE